MNITTRSFELKHLKALYRFLGEARQGIANCHYLHCGDLCWQLFHMLSDFSPSDLIRIWEDEQGELVGFVLVYPPFGMFDIQVHPTYRQRELEVEMLEWAQAQITQLSAEVDSLYSLVNETDTLRMSLLEARGYQPMSDWVYMQRSLTMPIDTSPAISPFRIGDLTEVDVAARAQALASVFGAQPEPAKYQVFVSAPGYDPTLDVVIVDANEQVAAFALCWTDMVSKVGQFEPVGTVPAFRRQKLGILTLLEGMRRLHERGMQQVIVIVEASEEPAVKLYTSVGLIPRWKIVLYGKTK